MRELYIMEMTCNSPPIEIPSVVLDSCKCYLPCQKIGIRWNCVFSKYFGFLKSGNGKSSCWNKLSVDSPYSFTGSSSNVCWKKCQVLYGCLHCHVSNYLMRDFGTKSKVALTKLWHNSFSEGGGGGGTWE